jgi:hypothetical protein
MAESSMTSTHVPAAPVARRSAALRFLRHYLEMVLVMIAGMLVLGSALALPAAALGAGPSELSREAPAVVLLGMGFSMTAPMVWWMRRRGHSRAATREMAGAMIVPTLAVVALLALGVDDIGDLLGIQHVAMFPSMLAVMLLRRQEYSHAAHTAAAEASRESHHDSTAETNERQASSESGTGAYGRRVAALLARRWPTWIALAVVAVTVADGGPLPLDLFAWLTLVMPLAYLGFGAARKDLQPAAMLMLQLAALGFYVGLTAVALSVDDDLARYLLAFGWIAHAFWDGVFFHANRVVPRPWAEWCGVVDLCLGGAILFLG